MSDENQTGKELTASALSDEEKERLRKRLSNARAGLLLDQPFFAYVLLNLQMKEAPALLPNIIPWLKMVPTIGTDGKNLWYNPDFCADKTMGELKFLLAHEVLHPIFMHLTRSYGRDPELFNQAGDHVINLILKEAGFTMPKEGLCDDRFKGMTTDEVYDILLKEQQKKKQQGGGKGKGGQGHDPNCKGGCGHDHSKGPGGACGGLIKPTDEKGRELSRDQQQAMEIEWKGIVAQAAQIAKQQGRLPGGLESVIDELLTPKIPWQKVVAEFIERSARSDYSWEVSDRSYLQRGFYVPSLDSTEMGDIGIIIDTSGSVSDEELVQYASEISAICSMLRPSKIYVVYVDTRVAGVDEFEVSDLPLKFNVKGRGGTDFKPGFAWFEDQGIVPQCLIYFTDLCCDSYPRTPEYPVLWAVTNAGHYVDHVPFGQVLEIDMSK